MTDHHLSSTDRTAWFQQARFGLFVHWGLYSVHGRGEWAMSREAMPWDEYETLLDGFTAEHFDARQWARDAKAAGMKYAVLTTKHHDGFCLWDSKVCDFNVTRSAAKRDLVGEFVTACRAEGLRVGLYYSLGDWRHPGWRSKEPGERRAFVDWTHELVLELVVKYQPDVLWYDLPQSLTPLQWRAVDLNAAVRRAQPDVLINNRLYTTEDFATPEQHVAASPPGRLWEACMTTNGVWGHCPGDEDWKTPRQIALQLAQCAAGGGNLLLNVGPDATGRWPEPARTLLGQVGEWLRVHGEAIYPVQRHTLPWLLHGPQTVDGHTLFVFCDRWQRSGELVIGGLTNKVKSAQLLGTGDPLPFEQQAQTNPVAGGRVVVRDVPIDRPDILPVLKLRLDGPPRTQLSDRLHQADIHPVLPT